jgi:Alpha amylase, catalytic domain
MTGVAPAPFVYEINTAVWLEDLGRAAGRPLDLADVDGSAWDEVTPVGVDAVWLMGVWERSLAGVLIARANQDLQASFRAALPDLEPTDVIGSPYCVCRYEVDPRFGGRAGLAQARAALAARGVKLYLDYVPNHVAPDHPWVIEHPDWFVRGTADDKRSDPGSWLEVGDHVLAHGRDPYFPAWPDVVQLDAFSSGARNATVETLVDIAGQCDGIRCDMAMLMTNDVFLRTWQGRTGPAPPEEFWPFVLGALRARRPETTLVAEAYWDMEWTLQQQGFDYCYDKRLYDRILAGPASAIRDHLRADPGYQSALIRFLENHDEPRLTSLVDRDHAQAAAVIIATLPGATLWHEGQFEGRRVRPPVFLGRRPTETPDLDLSKWYHRLLASISGGGVRHGVWSLLEAEGWPDNQTAEELLAWTWTDTSAGGRHLVVVNFSGAAAQGRVRLPWPDLGGRTWQLTDLLNHTVYSRDGQEMVDAGLFVALEPWAFHVLAVH